ncbi:Asp-tRNA(Asn)/Glu-tRNA(Gln) amidotransferase GatCAB subunit C [Deinococcus irradiatisoli]|uniref:Aspartyl/glutamyl-tRNA(Asn/Gln) amidotransferase subunit C n=1 Tax=Deinococcus irradiatisoli TaxID=2202254 RepID=A0A2Z3JEM5_9DEIO|nr:Asp-tRNA(Asn)/Glu-tRNA(Gln) amidotransferase subunit GatC [Deinococcus irradiatisoli]AWN23647.1 Asp-tRNA(Asn)/Glu-tRNA(Gln) amidotransferase GatCAB subunit C [Deinococcus irradiatisoli]
MIEAAEMRHLLNLSRLDVETGEAEQLRGELNAILGYFEQLQAVDTAGVEEMQRPVALVNVMRDDRPGEMLPISALEQLAPQMQGGFIKVPRTVDAE